MVHPPEFEIRALEMVAKEMIDSGEESGYLVGVATAQHPSFTRTRRSSSSLERDLLTDAARAAASQAGFYVESIGDGVELVIGDGLHLRRYRIKSGKRTASGELRFMCGVNSTLLHTEPDGFFVVDRWILGYLTSDDHTVDEVVAAEIVGSRGSENGPRTLELGTVIRLTGGPGPRGFTSSDEGLDEFNGDSDGETGDGEAGGVVA